MRFVTLLMLAMLAVQTSMVNAENAKDIMSIDWLIGHMKSSAENLTVYRYAIDSKANITFVNSSNTSRVTYITNQQGAVNLSSKAVMQSMSTKTEPKMKANTGDQYQSYLINDTQYIKANDRWTKYAVPNATLALQVHDEIVGQVNLIDESNMKIVGTENIDGQDYYVLRGVPNAWIYREFLSSQLISAYFSSPTRLSEEILNASRNINDTQLINNSEVVIASWIAKDSHLLKKNLIQEKITATPEILNISTKEDFKIDVDFTEISLFNEFDSPVEIVLPEEARSAKPFIFTPVNNSTSGCHVCNMS